jgi:CDGSH-type Zn-finger protein/uncharacterized Fe-S cluster protein YjdI
MVEQAREPQIIAQDREQLAYLLTEAAEIEHGLLCCYLFAAYSLKKPSDGGLTAAERAALARWRGLIVRVAIDEMLHLALVSNLLAAIGLAPHLQRPNFPVAPGYHPSGVVVALAPFDAATIDHFVFLERPEGTELPDGAGFEEPPRYERATQADRLVPSSQDYLTVGHLYRGIRSGLVHLAERYGESVLFLGNPDAQVGADMALPGLLRVTDLASALNAVDTIVEQGEGSPTNPETSHFRRFVSVRDEYRALVAERPDFVPAMPVARNPVMRKPPDPQGKVHIGDPTAASLLDLGNAVYGLALRYLGRAFGQAEDSRQARAALVDASVTAMQLLTPIADLLCRLPASPERPDVNAGLTFTMLRSTPGFSQQRAAWEVLSERAREVAAGSLALAKGLDPSLEAVATSLASMADRLDRVAPAASGDAATSGRAPAPSPDAAPRTEVPSPATAGAEIEQVPGKKLLLRFETRRCIHSRNCVLAAPSVFLANVKGPWLHPDSIPVEALVAVAHACPSGAITYERTDRGPPETAPPVNVLRVRENGPLALHADIRLEGHGAMFRATFCRCGASKNKPFCDGSHHALPFTASGEPATGSSEPLAVRDGVVEVTPTQDGPLDVRGNLEICSGTGRTVARVERVRLCRCGGSSNKPFCDGTHARIGFRSH